MWDTEHNEIHSPIQQLRFNPLDLVQGEAYMAVNCMEEPAFLRPLGTSGLWGS